MKCKIAYALPGLITCAALAAGLALANSDSSNTPSGTDQSLAEMMKKVEPAMTPGPAHKTLDPLVGEWNVEVKMWMTPGEPPTVTKGSAKSAWVLKGRFVREEFDGDFMGQPFHGISYTGYDNVRRKYRSVWIDDMSTTIVTAEGDAEEGGKVIKMASDYACAMTGEAHKTGTQVYRILSRDKHVFEMYDPAQGNDSKVMELTYTRK